MTDQEVEEVSDRAHKALLEEGLAKMPAGWGEPPARKTANREGIK